LNAFYRGNFSLYLIVPVAKKLKAGSVRGMLATIQPESFVFPSTVSEHNVLVMLLLMLNEAPADQIKEREVSRHVARIREMRNAYRMLVGQPEGHLDDLVVGNRHYAHNVTILVLSPRY
jgi:hypothetical protein